MTRFHALVKEKKTITFPEQPLDLGGRPATEKEQGVRYKLTLELFERIERFARIERTSGTVVSNEEPESERTGSEIGTISGRV